MNNGGNNGGLMGPVNTTNPPPGAGMPEAYIVTAFDGPQGTFSGHKLEEFLPST
ncbi:hypothetical protein FRC18_003172 [Serendipita sp. 400]|nr:hypothetical protein FRC18_003172 [Serendipita sp. 400]